VRRLVSIALIVLAVGAAVFVVYEFHGNFGLFGNKSGGENPGGGSSNSSASGHIAWQTVDRSGNGFRVQMPSAVSETEIPAYDERGAVEPVEMIEAQVDPDTTYAVAWAADPPVERAAKEDAERTLDWARDGALGRTQTELVSEAKDERGGYPSRDFLARNAGGGIMNARLILAGTRLYMLLASFPEPSARHEEDMNHFFNSFSLIGGAQPSQ